MKLKRFLIRVLGILGIILIIILYLILYLSPTLKTINRLKRDIKLADAEVGDFLQDKEKFEFLNEREWRYIRKEQKLLKKKFPPIQNKIDLVRLSSKISGFIKNRASKDSIRNLLIASDSGGAGSGGDHLSTSREIKSALQRYFSTRMKEMGQREEGDLSSRQSEHRPDFSHSPFGNLNFKRVIVAFSADLKDALNFINHLTWGEVHIQQDKLYISRQDSWSCWMVSLKIFFLEQRGRGTVAGIDDGTFSIDQDSEILLTPANRHPVDFSKRELPRKMGEIIPGTKVLKNKPPLGKPQAQLKVKFILNAIIIGRTQHLALINKTLVKEGDWISGAKVTEITERKIVLEHAGQKFLMSPDSRTWEMESPESGE